MKRANNELRTLIRENNIFFWQIALVLQMSESSMTRMFRTELSEHDRKRILAAIKTLKTSKPDI